MLAAGLWQPSKDALQLIRCEFVHVRIGAFAYRFLGSSTHIQRHPERLRRVIGATEFVNLFGEVSLISACW